MPGRKHADPFLFQMPHSATADVRLTNLIHRNSRNHPRERCQGFPTRPASPAHSSLWPASPCNLPWSAPSPARCLATRGKMLPPPITRQISTPRSCTAFNLTCDPFNCGRDADQSPDLPISASPDIFQKDTFIMSVSALLAIRQTYAIPQIFELRGKLSEKAVRVSMAN